MYTHLILTRERKMVMLCLQVYCFIFFSFSEKYAVRQHNWQTLANGIDQRNRNLIV